MRISEGYPFYYFTRGYGFCQVINSLSTGQYMCYPQVIHKTRYWFVYVIWGEIELSTGTITTTLNRYVVSLGGSGGNKVIDKWRNVRLSDLLSAH